MGIYAKCKAKSCDSHHLKHSLLCPHHHSFKLSSHPPESTKNVSTLLLQSSSPLPRASPHWLSTNPTLSFKSSVNLDSSSARMALISASTPSVSSPSSNRCVSRRREPANMTPVLTSCSRHNRLVCDSMNWYAERPA